MGARNSILTTCIAAVGILSVLSFQPARAAVVQLAWDPPTDTNGVPLPDLGGFIVCRGTESGNYTITADVGRQLSATLENLDPHITYFLAVRSYSLSGVQSDASEELVWAYDADGDDMPDGWEICHFGEGGGPNTGRDDDYDGDGMLNIQEFVAGTDPVNPTDAAGLRIEMKNGQIIASFGTIEADGPGCAGLSRTYTLEESTNLLAGAWQPVSGCENMPASGSVIEVPLAAPGARPRFFRTQVRLQ